MCDVIVKKSSDEVEYSSLEFIEDSYLPKIDSLGTPSLDEVHEWSQCSETRDFDDYHYDAPTNDYFCDWTTDEADHYLRSLTLDQILDIPLGTMTPSISVDEMQTVEAEFSPLQSATSYKLKSKLFKLFKKQSLCDVRVTFIDLSKPYLAKVSSGDNYKQFIHIGYSKG